MSQSPSIQRHRAPAAPHGHSDAPAASSDAATQLYARVLERMSARMSLFSFRGFLEPLRAVHLAPGELTLVAPSAFARDWARDHYAAELGKEAALLCGVPTLVSVVFDEEPVRVRGSAPRAAAIEGEGVGPATRPTARKAPAAWTPTPSGAASKRLRRV